MTNKELQDYLKKYDGDSEPRILAVNPKKRVRHEIENVFVFTDVDVPVFCLELGKEIAFDEEETALAEECEREAVEDESNVRNG